MQAVILAAGKSSRFFPFNNLPHKSFLNIAGKRIIERTLESIKRSGITDVIIVVGQDSPIPEELGNGEKFGLQIQYVTQRGANGQGDALLAAKDLIHGNFFLLHGHRLDFEQFKTELEEKQKNGDEVVLLGREEESVSLFGVPSIEGDRVVDLVEKPSPGDEPSKIRVIGVYLLTHKFLEVLGQTPSEHYHLEKAIALFSKKFDARIVLTQKKIPTLKYSWDILNFKTYILESQKSYISKDAIIAESAELIGENIYVSHGVHIMEGACIKGPAFIGENVLIGNNTLIREGSSIEKNAKVGAFTEVKNTLFGENATIHSGFLGDSILGDNTKIGAYFCTANVRFDRENISVQFLQEKVDTGRHSLGVISGSGVRIGIHASTMPGLTIGVNSYIGPGTIVMKNIDQNVKYYTEFKDIVEKKNEKST